MLYWLLGSASSIVLILLGIISYFYQRNQKNNDEEVDYMTDKYDQMSDAVVQGFTDLKNIITKIESRISVEEVKQGGFQETCLRLNKAHDYRLELLDKKVDQAADKLAEHELKIKLLELKKNGPGR